MGDVHVMPVGDLREHEESDRCWCAPTRDASKPLVVVHHAADMREHAEPEMASVERARA
jgi:hypothetical protein